MSSAHPTNAFSPVRGSAETGPLGVDLADDVVALQQTYREVQCALLIDDDPKAQVELLRRLADYRMAIADLDRGVAPPRLTSEPTQTLPSPVAAVPTQAPTPPSTPQLTTSPGAHTSGPASVVGPNTDGLTLRILIEGPPQAGTTTIMDQLSEQFRASRSRSRARVDGSTIDWFDFNADLFQGQPIRFELFNVVGPRSRVARRHFRSVADAIVLVIDSTPEGLGLAMSYAQEVEDDRLSWTARWRPSLTVFAHKEDAEDALPIDAVAKEIHLHPETPIVATTRRRRDILYGFALASSSAVRQVPESDRAGKRRTTGLPFPSFIAQLQQLMTEPQVGSTVTSNEPTPQPTVDRPALTAAPIALVVDARSAIAPVRERASGRRPSRLRRLLTARKTRLD